jgi:hypothetical protein
MRLERKETKRHNKEQEASQRLSAQASYLGAQASQMSAGAAAQQAKTRQSEYELAWEGAYAMPYGKDPTDLSNYITVTDVITGDKYTTTAFPEPITYSEKKANALEKMHKSAYEKAGVKKQEMETTYGQVRIVREGVGTINDTVNLGSKMINVFGSKSKPSETLSSAASGTDLILWRKLT